MKHGEFVTQNDLNRQAQTKAEAAQDKVNEIYRELANVLDDEERRLLESTQKAWDDYCIKQAEFSASRYEGSSLHPLTYFASLEQLAKQRIVIIKTELKEKKS
jgi:uncharacterized protein YecT (DUF1311 family)